MCIANSRATTFFKKSLKRNIIDMLRKERKWNHIKCLTKTTKAEKVWRLKIEAKNMGNKQKIVTNMLDDNPAISTDTLNINDLNTPI